MSIPMPSPTGRNSNGLFLPDGFFKGPMAQDEAKYPRAALPGAAGGKGGVATDDDDDDGITIVNSPTEAAMVRLAEFLADRLSPDDMSEVQTLLGQLLGATSTNGNGNGGGSAAMAGDARPRTPGYSQHFPNANRLLRRSF